MRKLRRSFRRSIGLPGVAFARDLRRKALRQSRRRIDLRVRWFVAGLNSIFHNIWNYGINVGRQTLVRPRT